MKRTLYSSLLSFRLRCKLHRLQSFTTCKLPRLLRLRLTEKSIAVSIHKLIPACVGIFLTSCITPLNPGAENVVLADGSHLPQCKILKHLIISDTNGSSEGFTSHENIEADQINILKNETYALGGNVLVITQHITTYNDDQKASSHKEVDKHTLEGDAYHCKDALLATPMAHKATILSDSHGE